MVRQITTDAGYDSDFPFSQGTAHGDTVYTAGQIPKDPDSREVVGETIEERAERTFRNLEAVLTAAGSSLSDVLKATVYLTDADEIDRFNEVYRDWVGEPHPARTTVEVPALAIDVTVEIEMIGAITE